MAQSGSAARRGTRLTSWWMRAILAALVIAVLTPAMAAAQVAAPETPEVVPAPSDPEPVLGEPESPPPPADEAPPAAEQPPASEPTTPPQAEEPGPTEPTAPPAPPAETTPVPPGAEGPAAPPAPPEVSPTPVTTTPLPGTPDAPRAIVGGAVLGPALSVDGGPGALPKAVPPIAVKVAGGPTPPPAALAVSTLGTPTAPPGPPAPQATPPASRMDAPPPPELSRSLFEAAPTPPAPTRRDTGLPAAEANRSGTNPFDTIAATGGPLPAGSSLLAVLASYVLPGVGAPPGTVLLLFVQLAVILAAFFAPPLGLGERALALARVGPRSGYRTVLARPG